MAVAIALAQLTRAIRIIAEVSVRIAGVKGRAVVGPVRRDLHKQGAGVAALMLFKALLAFIDAGIGGLAAPVLAGKTNPGAWGVTLFYAAPGTDANSKVGRIDADFEVVFDRRLGNAFPPAVQTSLHLHHIETDLLVAIGAGSLAVGITATLAAKQFAACHALFRSRSLRCVDHQALSALGPREIVYPELNAGARRPAGLAHALFGVMRALGTSSALARVTGLSGQGIAASAGWLRNIALETHATGQAPLCPGAAGRAEWLLSLDFYDFSGPAIIGRDFTFGALPEE